ncbi:MAG: hypothetical protein LQ343_004271 [Gyalolechia ehrenbergii]|nr:MAG: hypothetical protein LQ343_004271 [Gyalolechia ehrenbergii]
MATAGPELPPHLLAKRKRQKETEETQNPSPQPRPRSRSSSPSSSSNADDSKRRRTIGPAPPPASLSDKPATAASQSVPNDSGSDDDLGPSLPPSGSPAAPQQQQDTPSLPTSTQLPKKPQREEWMLIPPSQDDWSARIDPTKLRNRKFNAGKGAKAPPSSRGTAGKGDSNALWTETPEQKRQRLEDEMMGVKKPAQLVDASDEAGRRRDRNEEEKRETERRIREFNVCDTNLSLGKSLLFGGTFANVDGYLQEKNRGASLYEEHRKQVPKEKEDDPSKRTFDKEKDMGGGMKIGHAKRKEMMNKAADFGSRFAGGKYL